MGDVVVRKGFRFYKAVVTIYANSIQASLDRKCVRYQFTNIGDTIVKINQMICYPGVPGTSLGDSRSISSFQDDLYRGPLEISFQVPLGTNPAVEIVQIVLHEE